MPSGYNKNGEALCLNQKCIDAKLEAHRNKVTYNSPKLIPSCLRIRDVIVHDILSSTEIKDEMFALINLDKELLTKHYDNGELGNALALIYYRLNPYLPDHLKYNRWAFKQHSTVWCDDTEEFVRSTIEVVLDALAVLEDRIAKDYYTVGKQNHLEFLRRRFRKNWGETANNKTVEVKQNTGEPKDNNIEVVIRDA